LYELDSSPLLERPHVLPNINAVSVIKILASEFARICFALHDINGKGRAIINHFIYEIGYLKVLCMYMFIYQKEKRHSKQLRIVILCIIIVTVQVNKSSITFLSTGSQGTLQVGLVQKPSSQVDQVNNSLSFYSQHSISLDFCFAILFIMIFNYY